MSTTEPQPIGPADPDEPLTVTVTVRPRNSELSDAQVEARALTPISERAYPGRETFAADPADLVAIESFARRHGLHVAESNAALRRVVLTGRTSDFASAFGVTLRRFQGPAGEYRGTNDEIRIPPELQSRVESILGLDDRPAAHPRT
jgi:kumamolisin